MSGEMREVGIGNSIGGGGSYGGGGGGAGGSGGGALGGGTTPDGEPLPNYPNSPVVNTIAPFLANNGDAIMAQLMAGYGGTPEQYEAQANSIYSPARSVGLFEPLTETKAAIESGDYNTGSATGLLALDRVLGLGDAANSSSSSGKGGKPPSKMSWYNGSNMAAGAGWGGNMRG